MKNQIKMLALVVGVVGSGCGMTPTQTCKETITTVCKRVFECYDATTKASTQFIGLFGASETECNSKWNSTQCANVTDSNPCSDSSKTYSSSKAAACIDDYKAASCATLTGGTFSSGNCNNTCS